MTATMPRAGATVLASLAGLLLLGASPATASVDVGVAAAVNPEATGRVGATTRQLTIGKNILYNERISTSARGLVQVLFVDGSTITVGPNSDLVIDKFVYNPRTEKDELVATFTKGALRFVGGKVSKNEGAVTVNTPVGSLGIRGGMFQGALSGGKGIFSFLFGNKMTFGNQTVYEPNYTIETGNGAPPVIRPTTQQDAQMFVAALSGQGGAGGGATNKPTDNQVQNNVSNQNSENQQNNTNQQFSNPNNIVNYNNQNDNNTRDIVEKLIQDQQTSPEPEPKVGGTFAGYASGMFPSSNTKNRPTSVFSLRAGGIELVLDPVADTVTAELTVNNVGLLSTTQYRLSYGGEGNSGYLNDRLYAALHGGADVINYLLHIVPSKYKNATHVEGNVSSGALGQAIAGLDPKVNPFCSQCDFIKWGSWQSTVQFGNSDNPNKQTVHEMQGFWVAGDMNNVQLPFGGTATYEGSAVGYASDRVGGHWTDPRVATGNMNMDWNFGSRSGNLNITNFDQTLNNPGGYSFGGTMVAPGQVNQFAGALSGSGLLGAATGSFVNPPINGAPGGVVGEFGVGSANYQATGVFGGSQKSFTPSVP